ncbi:MAG: NH(3)-dependent NAD(+) synthetase [Firmicutes bacterium]|nr:NH(3)-dependent NAD(+) synthetase [Bacillota bacterium]
MEAAVMARKISAWIAQQVRAANMNGVVFGLSGGLDSAVVAGLAKLALPECALGVILPIHSDPIDREHALLVARAFALKVLDVDLSTAYDAFLSAVSTPFACGELPRPTLANIKPRLRMAALYFYASMHSCVVLGTGNLSEYTVGYFTKHGDGGVDLMPLAPLVKAQVRELALYLEVPQVILDKPPTAGLWINQTDEEEIGVTYAELDQYILTGEAEPHVKERVDHLAAISAHKKRLPPTPKL